MLGSRPRISRLLSVERRFDSGDVEGKERAEDPDRCAGQLDKAEAEAHIASALDPAAVDGYWVLAEVYLRRGDYVTAEREALEVKAR